MKVAVVVQRYGPSINGGAELHARYIAQRLRELAFLNKGLKITLADERTEKTAEFKFTGGITEFVKHLNRGKSTLHDSPIYMEGKRGNVEIEIALQYNDTYGENIFAFANTINTVDGGTHLSGFRSALTRSINNFASAAGMLKEQKSDVPLILVTGSHSEEVAVECIKQGADDYILKQSLKRLPSALVSSLNKRENERRRAAWS